MTYTGKRLIDSVKKDGETIHRYLCEIRGTSEEEKPTGAEICDNSTFLEMDTGDLYYYSAADCEWKKLGGD